MARDSERLGEGGLFGGDVAGDLQQQRLGEHHALGVSAGRFGAAGAEEGLGRVRA
ncbi:hypothetical protein ACGV4K_08280 [Streptomyces sp. WAC8370]|uniref:hypothetical protein n=1 Tax=Streptomyces sp. WAC8370 TaxID=3351348 RepID=UPI003F7B157B